MKQGRLLDAPTAAGRLGIARATLYAYVSRGLVAAVPDPADPRRRLYRAADIARLAAAQARGRKPGAIAAAALDWGVPALPSRITLIAHGRPWYRGGDALRLAESASLEDAACLLWDRAAAFDGAAVPVNTAPPDGLPDGASLFERGRVRFAWAEGAAPADAAGLLRLLTACMTGLPASARPIHDQLAEAWALGPEGAALLRMSLVLLADHELNVSAFAVRVVASGGASLAACVSAGLAALSGPRHGGASVAAAALLRDAASRGVAAAVAARPGRALPAFGHPLYPDGDPRAALLLARLPPDPLRDALAAAAEAASGQAPNIDFALAAACRALGLPEAAALVIFAVARGAGWIAHALEQRAEPRLIRPRAEYVGPRPAF
ncbi:MAG TPA: citrate synthase [Roseomonas sp.]|jgi:citrate synthase